MDLGQKQVTDRRDDQVTLQALIFSPLIVIQAEFAFLVFEATLDLPAIMPPKEEVGWSGRSATGPQRVYRAGRGFGVLSFARRALWAQHRGSVCSSRSRASSPASAQIT